MQLKSVFPGSLNVLEVIEFNSTFSRTKMSLKMTAVVESPEKIREFIVVAFQI